MVLEQYNHTFIGVLTVNYHTFIKNDEELFFLNSEDKSGYRLKSILDKLLGMIFNEYLIIFEVVEKIRAIKLWLYA